MLKNLPSFSIQPLAFSVNTVPAGIDAKLAARLTGATMKLNNGLLVVAVILCARVAPLQGALPNAAPPRR